MRILIVLPVLNEAALLRNTIAALRSFCAKRLAMHEVLFVIADNGSTDGTGEIGATLVRVHNDVRYLRLAERGKGRAIRAAWLAYDADAYAFMDVDLSTDIEALPRLIACLEDGADIAAGSRFHGDSVVARSFGRRLVSFGYRSLLRLAFGTKIQDAPCGFKAVTARVVREVVPETKDDAWFFDTELLLRAERSGLRIDAVPVRWSDVSAPGRRSKVHVPSLAVAYARRVLSLRISVGPPPFPEHKVLKEVVFSISAKERRALLAACVVGVVLVAAPVIHALLYGAVHDLTWTGRSIFAPGDTSVYFNQIAQARDGAFFFVDQATTERVAPLANPFWFVLGVLSRLTGMSPLASYTAARIALVPVLAAVFYIAIASFITPVRTRLTAFAVAFFCGGVGLFFTPFIRDMHVRTTQLFPIDLWVAESLPVLSLLYSPHFMASWAALVATIACLFLAIRNGRMTDAAVAGIAFLALSSFHPFYVPVVLAVGAAFLLVDAFDSGIRGRSLWVFLTMCAIASPAIAYHAWAFLMTGNNTLYGEQNILLTPPLPYVMLGFGLPLVAALWSVRRMFARRPVSREDIFLAVWMTVSLALCYAPISFQRRLLEGVFFPVSLLAAPLFLAVWDRVVRMRHSFAVTPAVFSLAFILLISSAGAAMIRTHQAYAEPHGMFYEYEDENASYAWARAKIPKDAYSLAVFSTSNTILGLGERPVYAGHWALTLGVTEKFSFVERYYTAMSDEERTQFLRSNGISYVWYGHDERELWPSFRPDPSLEEAFVFGNVTVYRFRE